MNTYGLKKRNDLTAVHVQTSWNFKGVKSDSQLPSKVDTNHHIVPNKEAQYSSLIWIHVSIRDVHVDLQTFMLI